MKRATSLLAFAALVAGVRLHAARRAAARPVCGISRPPARPLRAATSHFRITAMTAAIRWTSPCRSLSGANEDTVARTIRRALSSQLPRDRYSVQLGEGTNVLVSDPRGRPNFSLELVDSDIENVRVAVQSVTPAARPRCRRSPCPRKHRPPRHRETPCRAIRCPLRVPRRRPVRRRHPTTRFRLPPRSRHRDPPVRRRPATRRHRRVQCRALRPRSPPPTAGSSTSSPAPAPGSPPAAPSNSPAGSGAPATTPPPGS